ncbi:4'-phosphopantetheinyl transferase superfamily protein [Streptomyces sp. NPDC050211]|uniref:4'-phosphopantetheinyl transferase family protein n=1 Tax=Streptomyces sp. NPDC050211 TaxID=3154932 RepID=UPI003415EC7C
MPLTARPAEAARLLARGAVVAYGSVSDWADRAPSLRGADAARLRGPTHPEVRARFLAARALLHHIIGTTDLAYDSGGRPCLRGAASRYAVSLSHTEGLVLVGLCERTAALLTIGVDLERTDRPLDGPRFPSHMCTPRELARLARTPAADRNALLVRWWTAKEAYSKAVGRGLALDFRTFGTRPPPGWTLRTHTLTTSETTYTAAVAIGPESPKDTP